MSVQIQQQRTRRLVTDSGRRFVTAQTVDELVEDWREKYDRIFATEAANRRRWGVRRPDEVEAEIAARQIEWDAYVTTQLADVATAREE